MKDFITRVKRVHLKDIIDIWKLPIAVVASFFYRFIHKDLWIVCESPDSAHDNGFWFYRYIRQNHPEQECVYAIKKDSLDYQRVKDLGDVVEFGSLRHWILYFASSKKFSSQKAGNPNAALFYFLEVYGLIKNIRVFLQHGITKDDSKWLYYEATKIGLFICGAYPEYEYVSHRFGYPDGAVSYTGLCRFDGLHDYNLDDRIILIMPTWREWIADEDSRLIQFEGTKNIQETEYFKAWNGFINDRRITDLSRKYGVKFVFMPHKNMQKYIHLFSSKCEGLDILNSVEDNGIQEIMKRSSAMITDYSSVFFDMVYMKKPVVFYQFDYDKFRMGQYEEGYFDYLNNPFGMSHRDKDEVFSDIEGIIKNDFLVSNTFLDAHKYYFNYYDKNNCKRVFEIAKEL